MWTERGERGCEIWGWTLQMLDMAVSLEQLHIEHYTHGSFKNDYSQHFLTVMVF